MPATTSSINERGLKAPFWRWVRSRGGNRPPLVLHYRQIFILPSRFGVMFGMILFAMLMGSLNFNNNLGLLTTFIAAALALVSMHLTFLNLRGLKVRGCTAEPVFAGQVARLMVHVATPNTDRPGLALSHAGASSSFALAAGQASRIAVDLATKHRGWMQPPRMRIETTHPTGLFRGWSWFWPDQPVLVWPRPAPDPPELPRGAGQAGSARFVPHPQGEEFYALREWREGDPLHLIAWKASQRHDALLSREFCREQAEELVLDLDETPGNDLEQRISILTAWVNQASAEGRRWLLRAGPVRLGPNAGPAHRAECLRALAEL